MATSFDKNGNFYLKRFEHLVIDILDVIWMIKLNLEFTWLATCWGFTDYFCTEALTGYRELLLQLDWKYGEVTRLFGKPSWSLSGCIREDLSKRRHENMDFCGKTAMFLYKKHRFLAVIWPHQLTCLSCLTSSSWDMPQRLQDGQSKTLTLPHKS